MMRSQPLNDRSPDPARPRPTWVRWRVVMLLLALSFMSWFNRVSMAVAYDERIRAEYGISEEAIGYVYSAFLFAYMLCMTPGGWFADRYGAWLALALMGFGTAVFAVVTGIVGFVGVVSAAGLLILLLVIRSVMGLFTAPMYPSSGRVISHWLPFGQRAAANGMVTAAALVGIASTYLTFGTLIDWLDWPGAFLISGAATALLAFWWTWYVTDRPAQHRAVNQAELQWIAGSDLSAARASDPSPGAERALDAEADAPSAALPGVTSRPAGWRALLANRSLMLLTFSYAAVGYFEYLFFFWMHYYFEEVLKLGTSRSRVYSTILYLAMAAGMVAGGWLSDRLLWAWGPRVGRAAVAAGGLLAGALLLYMGLRAEAVGGVVTWFALALAAVGATEGPFWATAIELGGPRAATSGGIVNTGGNAGGLVAPIVTPLVSRHFGWQWGIGLGSLVCLAGVCLWWWIDPRERVEDRPTNTLLEPAPAQ